MSASANVRSLLRTERKARRIEHPHATYNSSGVLACQLCHISIKAESLWNQHIHGSHHRGQLQRLKAAQASKAVANANATKSPTEQGAIASEPNRKKRKADDDEDIEDDEVEDTTRKRTRAATASTTSIASPTPEAPSSVARPPDASKQSAIDEAEWEAFTREMGSPPPSQTTTTAPSALAAAATISAAPISAAELAARSRAEESTQVRETREAEAEGEREDAAQRLEDEFEEQDQLLDRVKRLKEKREALRQAESVDALAVPQKEPKSPAAAATAVEDEDEDEDDEDDWTMWPR